MKIDSDLNKQIVSLFQDHQSKISSDFAAINKRVEENISEWSRQNGGGGKTTSLELWYGMTNATNKNFVTLDI